MHIFVDKINGVELTISEQDIRHLKVRRHSVGDKFKVIETKGENYALARITSFTKNEVFLEVLEKHTKPLIECKIILYQSIIKKSNMDLVVQKAVELGVHEIIPVITERVSENKDLNYDRLETIAREAAMQSEGFDIPSIQKAVFMKDIIAENNLFCLGERNEREMSIKSFLQNNAKLDTYKFLIGPEGGFSRKEFILMKDKNVPILSFGDSILRSETASISVLALLRCFCLAK
jgi:16S rRNA (uracil1498-N3)-methyltransferase